MNGNTPGSSPNADRGRCFPVGFLWGAATSSHQVEGNNRWNDWWEYEQSGRLPFSSGNCCQHYEHYERDFDLAQSWGHNCHRFSIEWSRIEPVDGQWNPQAVDHYSRVIKALRVRGIEPVVTLHHFTLPAWFARRGGWERADSPQIFARFVSYFLERLDQPVTYWLTINEPTVYVLQAYINGEWPPLRRASWWKALLALRNLARAHVSAYHAIKNLNSDAKVGFAHNSLLILPCNPQRRLDRLASRCRDFILNRVFFRLIGVTYRNRKAKSRNLDLIGINYYTRCCVKSVGFGATALLGRACKLDHHAHTGPRSAIGWEIYPRGLASVLARYNKYGLPLFITENGVATDDDPLRCRFVRDHIKVLADAIRNGAHVLGYLHWSLLDNYEWALGTGARFGLAEVDYTTQKRIPSPAAEVFANICRSNRI